MAQAGVNQARMVLESKIHLLTHLHHLPLILIPLILLTMMMTLKIVMMTEIRIKAINVQRKEHFTVVTLLVRQVHQTQHVQVGGLETRLADWWQESCVN